MIVLQFTSFCSKKEHIIYSIKMVLLGGIMNQDLPKGVIFGKGQLGKIKKFVKFVLFGYIPW